MADQAVNPTSGISGNANESAGDSAKCVKSLRNKRRAHKGRLTQLIKSAENQISTNGSKTFLRKTLNDIELRQQIIADLVEKLAELLSEEEFENEDTQLQQMFEEVQVICSKIMNNLQSRSDEALTVISLQDRHELPSQSHDAAVSVSANQAIPEQLPHQSEATRQEIAGNASAPLLVTPNRDSNERARSCLSQGEILARFFNSSANIDMPTPNPKRDDWIDRFVSSDIEFHSDSSDRKSSVKIKPPYFDGNILNWHSWSELFLALVHNTNKSTGEKMSLLHECLSKDCQIIIEGLGSSAADYKDALVLLRDRFGDPEAIKRAHERALDNLEKVKGNDPSSFCVFSDHAVSHLRVLSRALGAGETLCESILLKLENKLPLLSRMAWREVCPERCTTETLSQFSDWLRKRAHQYRRWEIPRGPSESESFKAKSHAASASVSDEGAKYCSDCNGLHKTANCMSFKSKSVGDRLEIAKVQGLCFSCLDKAGRSHMQRSCPVRKKCSFADCRYYHHPLLHDDSTEPTAAAMHAIVSTSSVALGVIKVNVIDVNGMPVSATLLLDEGSDSTLISDSLAKKLGLSGKSSKLKITGVTGTTNFQNTSRLSLKVETPHGSETHRIIEGWSLPKVCDGVEPIAWPNIKQKWDHLKTLPLETTGGKVDILLGLDHACLLRPLDTIVGSRDDPYGILTEFGWVVRGRIGDGTRKLKINCCQVNQLHEQLRTFWETESFGTEYKVDAAYSPEDKKVIDLVKAETRQLEVGYEVPLPWKEGEPALQNNYSLALHRFFNLEKKFSSDFSFAEKYKTAIHKYLDEGYAKTVTNINSIAEEGVWYLPHHGVFKQGDKTGKLRVVFDSAAKYKGKSLNDALLTGPALQNDLTKVLIGFREYEVAVSGDIEAMFSRVRMRAGDSRYHRFLWRDDPSDELQVYQMDRLAFGDASSPYLAISALHRTAEDHDTEGKPELSKAIKKKVYVDDYCDSTPAPQSTIERAKGVANIMKKGDFKLSKWTSNSLEVRNALGAEIHNESNLGKKDGESKILGLKWSPADDTLYFSDRIDLFQVENLTRRKCLSQLASLFDPLGLLSPIVLSGKVTMQRMTIAGLGWDDPLPETFKSQWSVFQSHLVDLSHIHIPRCLLPEIVDVHYDLHTFCDASEEAFAAVVYVRSVSCTGVVSCRLAMAKTKVAPKKTISVAKLELQAALLGARLCSHVESALSTVADNRYFWTDSTCVRNWIRCAASQYKPFVSHRIGEIQTLTTAEEWRHLPGSLNVSDLATRSNALLSGFLPSNWFFGPAFLYEGEGKWPKDLSFTICVEEARSKVLVSTSVVKNEIEWENVKLDKIDLNSTNKIGENLKKLLLICQEELYTKELLMLNSKKQLDKKSSLLSLNPFIGQDGLLRVGGRIGKAVLPYDARHPIILPSHHKLTDLIIDHYHEKCMHSGTEYVLSHIRQSYWIVRGREAVKKAKSRCRLCLEERVKPATQLMSELPIERLEAGKPPFFNTSLDYFGPMEIVEGRNKVVKRYGCIFTCMSVRAVHLELAQSLSSSDFLNAFERFRNTRGSPNLLYSDNGTNFIGAEKELKPIVDNLKSDKDLECKFSERGVQWKFQPPGAPHWGGVHEALVKSSKRALYRVMKERSLRFRYLRDDELRTLLAEVMGMLNSRPLTYVSSDPADLTALTPNHFLIQRATLSSPPGDFKDACPKDSYKHIQNLANEVWKIWQKYYLPTLVSRAKWRSIQRDIKLGDEVLVVESNLPRGQWRTGHITKTHPGQDGLTRAATVTTSQGDFIRPITKLCVLNNA